MKQRTISRRNIRKANKYLAANSYCIVDQLQGQGQCRLNQDQASDSSFEPNQKELCPRRNMSFFIQPPTIYKGKNNKSTQQFNYRRPKKVELQQKESPQQEFGRKGLAKIQNVSNQGQIDTTNKQRKAEDILAEIHSQIYSSHPPPFLQAPIQDLQSESQESEPSQGPFQVFTTSEEEDQLSISQMMEVESDSLNSMEGGDLRRLVLQQIHQLQLSQQIAQNGIKQQSVGEWRDVGIQEILKSGRNYRGQQTRDRRDEGDLQKLLSVDSLLNNYIEERTLCHRQLQEGNHRVVKINRAIKANGKVCLFSVRLNCIYSSQQKFVFPQDLEHFLPELKNMLFEGQF